MNFKNELQKKQHKGNSTKSFHFDFRWLIVLLKKLLPPNTEIIEEYLHPDIKFSECSSFVFLWVKLFRHWKSSSI